MWSLEIYIYFDAIISTLKSAQNLVYLKYLTWISKNLAHNFLMRVKFDLLDHEYCLRLIKPHTWFVYITILSLRFFIYNINKSEGSIFYNVKIYCNLIIRTIAKYHLFRISFLVLFQIMPETWIDKSLNCIQCPHLLNCFQSSLLYLAISNYETNVRYQNYDYYLDYDAIDRGKLKRLNIE